MELSGMVEAAFHIAPLRSAEDLAAAATLFEAYAASLGVDLSYQGFAAELAGLPGQYASPHGALLLARDRQGAPIGCVALRPLPRTGCCELKRLYVSRHGRGLGLGKALASAIIAEARDLGYVEMWLDSLPTMHAAITLYHGLGFEPLEPYYDTPVNGTVFLKLNLTPRSGSGR